MSKEELKLIALELEKHKLKHIGEEIKREFKKELIIKPIKEISMEKEDIIMKDEKEPDYKILQNLIKERGCTELFKSLENTKILHKKSISDSIIIFGTLKYNVNKIPKKFDVALKVIYKPLNVLENSLLVENQIYENVISDLKYNDYTPHIVDFIGSYDECNLPLYQFNTQTQKEFEIEKDKINRLKKYDMTKATVIVTIKSSGNYLLSTFDKFSNDNKLIVIFQVLYTLLCFNHKSLKHNDLHWENIFVNEYLYPRSYSYSFDNKIFTIKSFVDTFIYDFDRSSVYHPAVDRNFINDTIEFCQKYNQCNGINNKMDFQAFLGTLIKYTLTDEIKKWILSITSDKFRERLINRSYPQYISGNPEISDEELKPLDKSLISLLNIMKDKSFFIKGNDENKIIYKLPIKYKILHEPLISSYTHQSYGLVKKITIDKQPSDKNFNDLINNKLQIDSIYLFNLYNTEYSKLNYNIYYNTLLLFKYFFLTKPINSHIQEYVRVCFVMSLPFWYKLKYDIKNALFKIFFNVKSYEEYKLIEDDIWNVFQGRLPIKYPILSYS